MEQEEVEEQSGTQRSALLSVEDLIGNLRDLAPPWRRTPESVTIPGPWVDRIHAILEAARALLSSSVSKLDPPDGGLIIIQSELGDMSEGAIRLLSDELDRALEQHGDRTPRTGVEMIRRLHEQLGDDPPYPSELDPAEMLALAAALLGVDPGVGPGVEALAPERWPAVWAFEVMLQVCPTHVERLKMAGVILSRSLTTTAKAAVQTEPSAVRIMLFGPETNLANLTDVELAEVGLMVVPSQES